MEPLKDLFGPEGRLAHGLESLGQLRLGHGFDVEFHVRFLSFAKKNPSD